MAAITTSVSSELVAARQAQQQLVAARRAQTQADQRIKLGTQLFKAAEAHLANQQSLLRQVRQEQEAVADSLRADVARSLRQHDDWMGQRERQVEQRVQELERRLVAMSEQWAATQQRVESLARRAERLLEGSRHLLQEPLGPSGGNANNAKSDGTARDEKPTAQDGVFGRMVKKMPPR